MKTTAPIPVIVHAPQTEEGWYELKKQVAAVHADMVNHRLQKLNCPARQKAALLDALITSAKEPRKAARPDRGITSQQ